MSLNIGLQLWSIKEETDKDFKGALKKVADIGYKGVEFAGYGNMSSTELKETLDILGLVPCGSHIPIDEIINNTDEVIKYNLEIGNEYIICPYETYEGKEDFIDMANKLSIVAEKYRKAGLKVGYHNHAHEFIKFEDEYGLDLILNNLSNDVIGELDVYWVQYVGLNPVQYINKHSGKFELIHIKDLEVVNGEIHSTEVGNGLIDIKAIVDASKIQGTKWFIIEQEFFTKPCMESVKAGLDYLKGIENEGGKQGCI